MKFNRLLLAFCVIVPTFSASAASVVMVQFGSFETNDEAQKRLSAIKSSHSDVLGSLPTSVREVKLPPDNLTVYRTQAGPLPSRSDAQNLCSKFANSGDECYVVETAMAGTPVPSANFAATPAVTSTTTTTTVTTPATPLIAPVPVTVSTASPSLSVPATTAVSSTRDAESAAALSRISTTPSTAVAMGDTTSGSALSSAAPIPSAHVTTSATPALAPLGAAPSSDMQSALDRAAAEQADASVAPGSAPVAAPAPKRSFWSHLNPFSTKPAGTTVVNNTPDVTPVDTTTPIVTSAALASPSVISSSSPSYASSEPNTMISMPATDASGPHLLPPPPPLTEKDKKFLEAHGATPVQPTPSTEIMTAPVPAPMPLGTPVTNSTLPSTAVLSAPTPPPAPTPGNGQVNVEEAKHVPLTETTAPTVPPLTPDQPAINLLPSSTVGQNTLWAQIGQFHDTQSALAFWQHYRQTHPDFPMTRIRVASSVQQQYHGNDKMWLRVGPFQHSGFIHNLCSSIATPQKQDGANAQQQYEGSNLRCGMVQDTGVAAEIGGPGTGYLSGSRYKR